MGETAGKKKHTARRVLWVGVSAAILGTTLFFFYQYTVGAIGPVQPIYFSHRVHAGVKEISCDFCHPFAARSRNPGIPEMEKCFYCHKYVIPMHPQIMKERGHYEMKDPVRWAKIYYVPDHVKFTHKPHIKWAKLDCTECHGNVKTMDRLQTVEYQMQFCITCHQQRNAQLDCWLACHH